MNIVSFFSGAGGLDLGFQQAGFNVIWANEYKLTEFKNPQPTHEQFLSFFYNWIYKQTWNIKVDHYIDIDHEKIRFLIKIK
jgi:site-specific DNA-cytosine methylase